MKPRTLIIFPLLLVLYEMAAYLSNDLYLPALPSIMQDLQISSELAQMTLTAWLLGSASMQLILGPLSDRLGRRPVLLYGGIVFILASLGCAMANNITLMLIARFFQGAVVCSLVVAGYASIHELLNSEQAIKTLAWMGGVAVLAPAFGPLLGGILLLFHGWRFLFFILVIWGAIILLALKHWMPESLPVEKRQPLHFKRVFKDYVAIIHCREFIVNMGVYCLIFAAIIAWIVTGPLLVIRDFHLTPIWFGITQALLFGSYILGTHIIKYSIRLAGVGGTLKLALGIVFIGALLAVIFAILRPHNLFMFIYALMFFELGAGMALAPLNRLAIEAAPQPMGVRVAVFYFTMGWFGVIGSVLASIFYNTRLDSLAWLILILTICAVSLKFASSYLVLRISRISVNKTS
jgi:Bcr/CflA subfamily drug resistance transporter